MNIPKLLLFTGGTLSCFVMVSSLSAQESVKETEENVYELSPFSINSDNDVGYYSESTLSGTRLNSSLFDTPASVSEMTNKFLEDIGALNLQEAVEYSLGFEQDQETGGGDNQSQFQPVTVTARGLSSNNLITRDYFPYNSRTDWFSTERLSFSRGPNSVLAGIGNAGGIINTSSKRAVIGDKKTVATVYVDNNGGIRSQLDYNMKVSDQLAIRTNLLYEEQNTWRDVEYTDSQAFQIAATWRPFEGTEIRGEYLRYEQDRLIGRRFTANDNFGNWDRAGQPEAYYDSEAGSYVAPNGTTSLGTAPRITIVSNDDGWYNFGGGAISAPRTEPGRTSGGIKIDDPSLMPFEAILAGPAGTSDNNVALVSLNVTQRLAENLYLDVGFNESGSTRVVNSPILGGNYNLYKDPNAYLPDGRVNPYFGEYFAEGTAESVPVAEDYSTMRAALTYELDFPEHNWAGKHQFVAFFTESVFRNETDTLREANLTPFSDPKYSATINTINRRTYIDFNDGGLPPYYDHNPFAQETYAETVDFEQYDGSVYTGTVTPGFYSFNKAYQEDTITASMIAGQSHFFDGRLALTWGLRDDTLKQDIASKVFHPTNGEVVDAVYGTNVNEYKGPTKTKGAVFRFWKGLAGYYNESDNFSPQSGLGITGENVGNVKGEGTDYGIKFRTEDGRFYARLGAYETANANNMGNLYTWNSSIFIWQIWAAIEGPDGPHASAMPSSSGSVRDTQDSNVEGYEFELTASPIQGLRLQFNASQLEGTQQNITPRLWAMINENRATWDQNADKVWNNTTVETLLGRLDSRVQRWKGNGDVLRGAYKYRYNLRGHYTFSDGKFEGLDVGLGFRYRDKRYISGDFYGPSFLYTDLSVSYSGIELWDKVKMNLRLDVKNILNDDDPVYISWTPDEDVAYDYVLVDPRTIRLMASFAF